MQNCWRLFCIRYLRLCTKLFHVRTFTFRRWCFNQVSLFQAQLLKMAIMWCVNSTIPTYTRIPEKSLIHPINIAFCCRFFLQETEIGVKTLEVGYAAKLQADWKKSGPKFVRLLASVLQSIETNLHREAVRTVTDLQRTNQRDKPWQEKKDSQGRDGCRERRHNIE